MSQYDAYINLSLHFNIEKKYKVVETFLFSTLTLLNDQREDFLKT